MAEKEKELQRLRADQLSMPTFESARASLIIEYQNRISELAADLDKVKREKADALQSVEQQKKVRV